MSFSNCLKCGVPIPEHKTYCPPHEAEHDEWMERERKAKDKGKVVLITVLILVPFAFFSVFYLASIGRL